jgi:hypothetical protein
MEAKAIYGDSQFHGNPKKQGIHLVESQELIYTCYRQSTQIAHTHTHGRHTHASKAG